MDSVRYRWRDRTYPYFDSLPYPVESQPERETHLYHIIKKLYITIEGDDLKGVVGNTTAPALAYWSRELRSWMELKFDMPLSIRIKLLRFYYAMCIGGIDGHNLDLMVNMFCFLAKDETLLRDVKPGELDLDWLALVKIMKKLALPLLSSYDGHIPKAFAALSRLALSARLFVSYNYAPIVLETLLPSVSEPQLNHDVSINLLTFQFNLSKSSVPHNIMTLVIALLPVVPLKLSDISLENDKSAAQFYGPQQLLPTIFQMWSLNSRSSLYDFQCLDICSNLAADSLASELVSTSKTGIMDESQLAVMFVAMLRMLEIPVSYVGSPYNSHHQGAFFKSDKEKRSKISRAIGTFIICSMVGEQCLDKNGIMDSLENMMHAIETFCHPSNQGPWNRIIACSVSAMVDIFSLRWNAQLSGESIVPRERWLTEKIKNRFVLAMREVTFLGIHSKSSTVSSSSLECLHGLAALAPDLIIPKILSEVYPSLEGLLETHRTIAALNCLTVLARTMARKPRYAVHMPTLMRMTIPGIDANDLTKTLNTLALIQSFALNIPLYNLKDTQKENSTDDWGVDIVSNDLNALSEDLPLPEYSESVLVDSIRASTESFEEFVPLFMGQVFNLLENLPDMSGSSKNGDLPEISVVNSFPPTITAVLGACSPVLFERVVKQVVAFVSNNVVYTATNVMAHICGCLVMINPEIAFKELFPILSTNLNYEVTENGAGSTRSGSETLPRDYALIWNLSCLNMTLTNAGKQVLKFKKELMDLIMLLRVKCKGHIVYHVANTLHHTLMTINSTYISDYRLIPPDEEDKVTYSRNWAQRIDMNELKNISWHVPCREEVALAVELYTIHCQKSFDDVSALMNGSNELSSVTEFADIMLRSLTYIRTGTSGMAVLFDSRKKKKRDAVDAIQQDSGDDDEDEEQEDGDEDDDEDDLMSDSEMELDEEHLDSVGGGGAALSDIFDADDDWEGDIVEGTLRKYPANYFFGDNVYSNTDSVTDSLYKDLHDKRDEVGQFLHQVHEYLAEKRENDFSSFKALMFAYKVWFSDVGFERSARPLDCLVANYAYETKHFRASGLRKDYARPILAARAMLYHVHRLSHNVGPRLTTGLEKILIDDTLRSVLSIYPDIQRNSQSALESAAKVLVRGRQYMYPVLLKDTKKAFDTNEYKKGESGLKTLKAKVLQASIKKDYKHVILFTNIIIQAIQTDYPGVSALATGLYAIFATNIRLPLDIISVNHKPIDDLKSIFGEISQEDETKIIKMKQRKAKRREAGVQEMQKLVDFLSAVADTGASTAAYWKFQAASAAVFTALCSSPQMPVDSKVLAALLDGAGLHHHPDVKAVYTHAVGRILSKMVVLATGDHSVRPFMLDYDEEQARAEQKDREIVVNVEEQLPGFGQKFIKEMSNIENPSFFIDETRVGWLSWSKHFIVEKVNRPKLDLQFQGSDKTAIEALGNIITADWLTSVVARHCEEPRFEMESLSIMNISFFRMIFQLIDHGFTSLNIDLVLTLIEELYANVGFKEKNAQRCVAEMCEAMLETIKTSNDQDNKKVMTVRNIYSKVINHDLSQETARYWRSFSHILPSSAMMDYRRYWPLIECVNDFQLSGDSTNTFRVSSKLGLYRSYVQAIGWYYQPSDDKLKVLWANIAHNFKGVRDEIGKTLASIYNGKFRICYDSVDSLLQANANAGSLGVTTSYILGEEEQKDIIQAFDQLEQWRQSWEPGDTSGKYILGAKTIAIWLARMFRSAYGSCLVPLLPKVIIPALLHFLNVRDDSELTVNTVDLFNMLGNIMYPSWTIQLMIDAIVDMCTRVSKWHQRLSLLSFTQAFFFRQMFLMTDSQRLSLVDVVVILLADPQLEVRQLAADTLAGMVRCSNKSEQMRIINDLKVRFKDVLKSTQSLRSLKAKMSSGLSTPSGTSTPTGTGSTSVAIQRHSAVLGLGALVRAFPYQSPPPVWIPDVLATLAIMAAGDPGMVGKSVKSTLSEFKKTRQDTWTIDSKIFSSEQLDDLEGVLWKNYFV